MILTLKTKNGSQECIKKYLEEHASPELAKKINNGVPVQKDGKTVINKKDLDGFWAYASQKARATKESYTENEVVFGWAMDYFNDDSIIGTLYTEDGKKYNAPKTTIQPVPAPTVAEKPKPQKAQLSFFDELTNTAEEQPEIQAEETTAELEEKPEIEVATEEETILEVDEETGEILTPPQEPPQRELSPFYKKYLHFQNEYPQAVIAYRLGDFYEVLGIKAIKVAEEMELTLTGRDCGMPERVPMVGFPYHAAESYFQRIAAFSQLVIVEQDTATLYALPEEEQDEQEEDFNDDLEEMKEKVKAFEQNAFRVLLKAFGDDITIQQGDIE